MAATEAPQQGANTSRKRTIENPSVEFDYDNVKKTFYESFTLNYGISLRLRFTKEMHDNIIRELQQADQKTIESKCQPADPTNIFNKYELFDEDGKVFLILKRPTPSSPILRVVPDEDCFDVLSKIHLKFGHGLYSRKRMMGFITKNYNINKNFVNLLFHTCNVCCLEKETKITKNIEKPKPIRKVNKGNLVYLDLINMQQDPDGLFEYILVYVNKNNHFILLRPLMQKCPIEISMEILKIFLDFGPPTKFKVFPNYSTLFIQALDHLKTLYNSNSFTIPVDEIRSGVDSVISGYVLKHLQKWIKDTGSGNWSLGLYILQWKLNNNFKEKVKNIDTPFSLVFNRTKPPSTECEDGTLDISSNEFCEEPMEVIEDSDSDSADVVAEKNFPTDNELQENEVEIIETDPLQILEERIGHVSVQAPPDPLDVSETSKAEATTSTNIMTKNKADRPVCHVCNCKIYKIYKCVQCEKPVHVFCSTRDENENGPIFTCTTCCIRKESEMN